MIVETSHTVRARAGETCSGDAVVVRSDGRRWLLAVVDALGHGEPAAEAARIAAECLAGVELDARPAAIQECLHRTLRGTRGAAAMVCSLSAGNLVGCGVGNVELRSHPSTLPVVLSPGILGGHVRRFREFEADVRPRRRLLVFTDGISTSSLRLDLVVGLGLDTVSRHVVDTFGHLHDDAAVLVADVRC